VPYPISIHTFIQVSLVESVINYYLCNLFKGEKKKDRMLV